jgi:hypothetical protein
LPYPADIGINITSWSVILGDIKYSRLKNALLRLAKDYHATPDSTLSTIEKKESWFLRYFVSSDKYGRFYR